MTSPLLVPFNLTVTVAAPVHIGSGERITSSEFNIRMRGQQDYLSVFGLDELLRWIAAQPNPERLANLLTASLKNPSKGDISSFLHEYKVPPDQTQIYALPVAKHFPSNERVTEVLTFIKTAGRHVFLPGSSLKGALRSSLLRGALIQKEELRKSVETLVTESLKRNEKRTNSAAIEAEVFVKPQVKPARWSNYDVNRLLHIRDSAYFEPQDALQLYAVRMLSVSKKGSLEYKINLSSRNPVTLFVEMLPIGFEVTLPAVWQAYLLSDLAAEIRQADREAVLLFWNDFVRQASINLLEQEANFYERHGRSELKDWFEERLKQMENSGDGTVFLPLGWGSGYDAKTITDLFSEQTFEAVASAFAQKHLRAFRNVKGLGRPGNLPSDKWLGKDDSPKSRKVIYLSETEALPLGWVAVRLQPADEAAAGWLQTEQNRLSRYKPAVQIRPQPVESGEPSPPAPQAAPQTQPPSAAAQSKPAAPVKSQPKALISKFDRTPKVGEVFEGAYVDEDNGEVLYEIPGLDFDEQAYAVVLRSQYPNFPKKMQRCKLTVEKVEEVGKNYHKVICDPEW